MGDAIPPIAEFFHHYMDQLDSSDYFNRRDPNALGGPRTLKEVANNYSSEGKQPLFVTISVEDIYDVDTKRETFQLRFNLFLLWTVDQNQLGICDHCTKLANSGRLFMDIVGEDRVELEKQYVLPVVLVENRISIETDSGSMGGPEGRLRLLGGQGNRCALMFVREFSLTAHQRFDLRDFPFDLQELRMKLLSGGPSTWNRFDLVIEAVQFNRQSLELSEWIVHTPLVRPGSPAHMKCSVCLQLERAPWYYVRHVYLVLCLLSSLGLVAFLVDSKEGQAERAGIALTLLLTSVAFKFTINERIPAVPYDTHMDSYITSCIVILALMTVLCVVPSYAENDVIRIHLNITLGILSAFIQTFASVWWIVKGLLISRSREMTKQVKVIGEEHNWYCYHYRVSEHLPRVTAESSVRFESSKGRNSLSLLLNTFTSQRSLSRDDPMPMPNVVNGNGSFKGDHHGDSSSVHVHTSNKYGAVNYTENIAGVMDV